MAVLTTARETVAVHVLILVIVTVLQVVRKVVQITVNTIVQLLAQMIVLGHAGGAVSNTAKHIVLILVHAVLGSL